MNVPAELKYSNDHEWVKEDDGCVVGVTDYAQDALGDVVFVGLPDVGREVKRGESVCEVESTKSVSDIYAPVSGTISRVNNALTDSPELINSSPYEQGWIFAISASDSAEVGDLLDAKAYSALTE